MTSQEEKLTEIGFKQAEIITKQYAKTFYFASRFLPKEKRRASYAVYAICRISDETVDAQNFTNIEGLKRLQADINAVYSGGPLHSPILLAFSQTINKYQIPKLYFDELIRGMYMDLEKKRYADFNELYAYCYKVAGVVGLVMLKIFGCKDAATQDHAVNLGIAMQLTNILRDIREDAARGRIYLPEDELEKFGLTEENITKHNMGENFKPFMEFQINRARDYYHQSQQGLKLIEDAGCRFVIRLMQELYAGILDAIERNRYDVFSKRAHLNIFQKIAYTLRVLIRNKSA